ncbi:MAG: efflux RND transporter periplasmic adaptor subunit [Thermodesulfovibrionales bacterium]
MRKRLAIAVSAVAAVAGLFVVLGLREENSGVLKVSGIVEGREVILSSKTAGRISEICCSEGDPVVAGQVAFRLESEDLAAALSQARAGTERARAEVATADSAVLNARAFAESAEDDRKAAQAELEKARVLADEQKLEAGRARDLFSRGFVSRADLDQASASADSAEAAVRSAEARTSAARSRKAAAEAQAAVALSQLAAAKARMKEAEAALRFQEARMRDTVIVSPIAGTIVFKSLEKGEYAVAGAAVMTVVDTSDLFVRIDLEESLVASLTVGASATVTADGIPGRNFSGTLSEIGRYAEFATQRDVTRGRQDLRTFRTKVKVNDPDRLLKPGMTVFVALKKP